MAIGGPRTRERKFDFSKQWNLRSPWLTILFVAGIGAVLLGRFWLFTEVPCPKLAAVLLYITAFVIISLAMIWAFFTSNDSAAAMVFSVVFVAAVILGVPFFSLDYVSNVPFFQSRFCPTEICNRSLEVTHFLNQGNLPVAEALARECMQAKADSAREEECRRECAASLVRVLYLKANPENLPVDYEGFVKTCDEKKEYLQEAAETANKYQLMDLRLLVEERENRLNAVCSAPPPTPLPTSTPTPTPTLTPTPTSTPTVTPTPTYTPTPTPAITVEVLRTRATGVDTLVDVRVIDLRTGESVTGLPASAFRVERDKTPLSIKIEERAADDPVCVIAVVDNSGSIKPGVQAIRQAILKLNDRRKPGDQLGMVVFAEHANIQAHPPSGSPLDPSLVDGSGKQTALWDATLRALSLAEQCAPSLRYLILLTDGGDNDSQLLPGDNLAQAREVERRAADANVSICAVGVRSPQLERTPLEVVAYGCGYYEATDFDAVAGLFEDIFGYVRDFYRIRLSSKDAPAGTKLSIHVENAEVNVEITR